MNTKKILGIAAVTLLVAMAFVGAAAATVSDDDVVKIGDTGYATMSAAVTVANAATDDVTITVLKSFTLTEDDVITINNANSKKITIDGQNKTITGVTDKASVYFEVQGKVAFKDLILQNFGDTVNTVSDGAVIHATNAVDLEVTNVDFIKYNRAAVDVHAGYVSIDGCEMNGTPVVPSGITYLTKGIKIGDSDSAVIAVIKNTTITNTSDNDPDYSSSAIEVWSAKTPSDTNGAKVVTISGCTIDKSTKGISINAVTDDQLVVNVSNTTIDQGAKTAAVVDYKTLQNTDDVGNIVLNINSGTYDGRIYVMGTNIGEITDDKINVNLNDGTYTDSGNRTATTTGELQTMLHKYFSGTLSFDLAEEAEDTQIISAPSVVRKNVNLTVNTGKTLDVQSTLNIKGKVIVDGTLKMDSKTPVLVNNGIIQNNSVNSLVFKLGTINNNGVIINKGKVDIADTATYVENGTFSTVGDGYITGTGAKQITPTTGEAVQMSVIMDGINGYADSLYQVVDTSGNKVDKITANKDSLITVVNNTTFTVNGKLYKIVKKTGSSADALFTVEAEKDGYYHQIKVGDNFTVYDGMNLNVNAIAVTDNTAHVYEPYEFGYAMDTRDFSLLYPSVSSIVYHMCGEDVAASDLFTYKVGSTLSKGLTFTNKGYDQATITLDKNISVVGTGSITIGKSSALSETPDIKVVIGKPTSTTYYKITLDGPLTDLYIYGGTYATAMNLWIDNDSTGDIHFGGDNATLDAVGWIADLVKENSGLEDCTFWMDDDTDEVDGEFVSGGTLFKNFSCPYTLTINGQEITIDDDNTATGIGLIVASKGQVSLNFNYAVWGAIRNLLLLGVGIDTGYGLENGSDISTYNFTVDTDAQVTSADEIYGARFIAPSNLFLAGNHDNTRFISTMPLQFNKITVAGKYGREIVAFGQVFNGASSPVVTDVWKYVYIIDAGGKVVVDSYKDTAASADTTSGLTLLGLFLNDDVKVTINDDKVTITDANDLLGQHISFFTLAGTVKVHSITLSAEPYSGSSFYTWSANETIEHLDHGLPAMAAVFSTVDASNTYFNYQMIDEYSGLQSNTSYLSADKKSGFTTPNLKTVDDYYIPGDVAAGLYYKDGDTDNDPIYIKQASVSYVSDTLKTKEVFVATTKKSSPDEDNYFYVSTQNAAGLTPHIVLKKNDTGAVLTMFPGDANASKHDYPLDYYTAYDKTAETQKNAYQLTDDDTGTWAVYADFGDGLWEKTPDEYRYVKLADMKVVSKKDHGTTVGTLSTNSVKNGEVFTVSIEAPKGDEISIYYKDSSDDDALTLITSTNTDNAFYLMNGQTQTAGVFKMPASEKLDVNIVANTKLITDKDFVLVIKNAQNLDENDKEIEVELDITVRGNIFTAALEKTSYALGEDVKITGTFEDRIPLYFYVQGTNVDFRNIESAYDKYYTYKVKSSGTDWTFTIDGALMTGGGYVDLKEEFIKTYFDYDKFPVWNDGDYTIYVSTVKPTQAEDSELSTKQQLLIDALEDEDSVLYDKTLATELRNRYHTYTTEQISKIVAGGKTINLKLTQPVITITDVQGQVEKNKYVKVTVDALGTDKLSLYVIGQNQMNYIEAYETKIEAVANDEYAIYSLKSGDVNYLFDDEPYKITIGTKEYSTITKGYPLTGTGFNKDNTVANVLKVYGPKEYADSTTYDKAVATKLGIAESEVNDAYRAIYEEYFALDNLVVKNNDGTYSFYLHVPASGWDWGQYYIVAQHPMADGVLNIQAMTPEYLSTYGPTLVNNYSTGWNIIANPVYTKDDGWTGTFLFNIPAFKNITAVEKLTNAITEYGDKYVGGDFYVVAEADISDSISGAEASYKQGTTITITVKNVDEIAGATLEANTFDFTADNLNVIRSFGVEPSKTGDATNYEMTLDTTDVPVGDYNIIIKDKDGAPIKTYETKITQGTADVPVTVSIQISGAPSLKVGNTTVLTAKMSDGSTAKFKWTSSDDSVASVDENGTVTAKKVGTATITVTNTATGKTATKTITVANESTPTVDPTPSTPETPKSPGFGILAALAGLGAVAALVLRRK